MKICGKCGEEKSLEDFHKNKKSPDGLHSQCKPCKNGRNKEYYEELKKGTNRPRTKIVNFRDGYLQRVYGITLQQYNQMLEDQNHCCAICGKHEKDERKSLAVDHNHVTREIRGLLCNYCNHRVVGRHRDGNLLRRIADYVEQGTGWFVPKKKRPKKRKPKRN